jgi:tRNA (cytidine/uridine-2'-O-)-methyltransferase
MRLALYQPDIPQNTGTILRLCGCLGIEAHIIEPAGFPSTDRAFRRAGMDYLEAVTITRHASWQDFEAWQRAAACRLVLFTTKAARSYLDFNFAPDDVLLFGRESAGAPEPVHAAADARLLIPMRPGDRRRDRRRRSAQANRRNPRTEPKPQHSIIGWAKSPFCSAWALCVNDFAHALRALPTR